MEVQGGLEHNKTENAEQKMKSEKWASWGELCLGNRTCKSIGIEIFWKKQQEKRGGKQRYGERKKKCDVILIVFPFY